MGNVRTEDLTKRYENELAVDEVSLDVRDGEFVTLVGPSGCGKSTTLEMIAGLTDPTEGSVEIAGRDVTNVPPKDRGIAMVFQNIALFPHMDVFDNISFGLRLRDVDDEEIEQRVEEAASIVQMEGTLDRMPEELSGGQRQRVAIARAIVREPEVFLMDEPLANLDAALRIHMRTELQRLHRELDATIVYVTHDQEEAMTMSNRLAVMNDGVVQQYDEPLECYNAPANEFVAGFIGSPSMNLFDGEVTETGVTTPYFDVEFDPTAFDVAVGQHVRLGVRPEDVALSDSTERLKDATEPFQAIVDVVEPVGDEVFVYFLLEAGGDREGLLMSTPPGPEVTDDIEGASFRLRLDRDRIHLFDADTGEALVHGLVDASTTRAGAQEAESN